MARERVNSQPDEITRARMAIELGIIRSNDGSIWNARDTTKAIDELIQLRIKEHHAHSSR